MDFEVTIKHFRVLWWW